MNPAVWWATDANAVKILLALGFVLFVISMFTIPSHDEPKASDGGGGGLLIFVILMGLLWWLRPENVEKLRRLPIIGKTFAPQQR